MRTSTFRGKAFWTSDNLVAANIEGQAIIDLCKEEGCSPLQFNKGAWYGGAYAFPLLMEKLAES